MFLMENRSAGNYLTVCTLLASGTNKVSDIAQKTGLSTSLVTSVLASLAEIDIVEKEVSVQPASRKPVWRIKDRVVTFYYRFRYPFSAYGGKQMTANYLVHINEFFGFAFEKLCRKALPGILNGTLITEMGRWWGGNPVTKKEEEIDIAAGTDDGGLTVCECKYISKDITNEVVTTLKRRASLISGGRKTSYIFFTKEKTALNPGDYPFCSFYCLDDVFRLLS